jgi:hypothetical protein
VSSPDGINCGSACSANFPGGTIATLNAYPAAGSAFSGWSGACSGTNVCTVGINNSASATATFNLQDFSVAPASTTLKLQPGGQSTDVVTLAGVQGPFNSAIQLTCSVSGPAAMPTCSFSSPSVTPRSASATSTLTISAAEQAQLTGVHFGKLAYAMWIPLMLGMVVAERSNRQRRKPWISCGAIMILWLSTACGGSGGETRTPTSYTVTVTGTSGKIQHSIQVAVMLQ